jgi:hypothetical protein
MKSKRIYKNEDGSTSIWEYDTAIKKNGPIMVTEIPAGHKRQEEVTVEVTRESEPQEGKKVSKTKMKYLNPATGKEVGYVRAKNLGLI